MPDGFFPNRGRATSRGERVPWSREELVALGRAVRELRARCGLSQEALGFRGDLHRNYVGTIERGEQNITFRVLLKLERGLRIPLSELIAVYERHRMAQLGIVAPPVRLDVSGLCPIVPRDDDDAIGPREIAAMLRDGFGHRVTAYLVGVADLQQIAAYASGAADIPDLHARRLRAGFKIVQTIATVYDTATAKAWLFGTNAQLGARAPIEVIARATTAERLADVSRAACAFARRSDVGNGGPV